MKLSYEELIGKNIDVHTHSVGIAMGQMLANSYPFGQDICDLSECIRRNNIDFAISFPMTYPVYFNINEMKFNKKYVKTGNGEFPYQLENYSIARVIDEMEIDNILPFLAVSTNDKIDEQLCAINDICQNYEIYGIKYHPKIERKSVLTKEFEPFVLFALDNNLPMMIHSDMSDEANPNNIFELVRKYENLRVCIAHCAHFDEEFWMQINNYDNVYVDASPLRRICHDMDKQGTKKMGIDFKCPEDVFKHLFELAPKHLVWGTDTPYYRFIDGDNSSRFYSDESKILLKSDISKEISDNSVRFLLG